MGGRREGGEDEEIRQKCWQDEMLCMNNIIYSTLFKTQERESDRRSKERNHKNTNKTTRTCDLKY